MYTSEGPVLDHISVATRGSLMYNLNSIIMSGLRLGTSVDGCASIFYRARRIPMSSPSGTP